VCDLIVLLELASKDPKGHCTWYACLCV